MDIVTYAAAKKGAAASAVKAVETRLGDISTNVTFKGSVATIEDLPSGATVGDEYAVGSQGLYVWNGTSWVPVSRAGTPGTPGEPGEKGDTGESGVYIGNTAPTDPDIKVWFNPDGAPDPDDVMLAGNYDADGAVADAGGIAAYVESHGDGGSGLITVARNVSLIYDDTVEEEADRYFYATIPTTSFPSDFLTLGKYNLIVVVTGEEDSTQVGYTANHFCYLNSDGFFMGRCIDEYSNESLYHYTAIESTENGYQIVYQGIMGEGKVLPDEGSKVSVYLQQLF